MKAMAGKGGDTVKDQVARRVLLCFWDRARANWGDEVQLGCFATGFKDGASVKFSLFESDGGDDDDPVKDITAKIDKGRATAKWKIDFKDPDVGEGDVYEFYFLAEIEGAIKNEKKECPILFCDLDPPGFSE